MIHREIMVNRITSDHVGMEVSIFERIGGNEWCEILHVGKTSVFVRNEKGKQIHEFLISIHYERSIRLKGDQE